MQVFSGDGLFFEKCLFFSDFRHNTASKAAFLKMAHIASVLTYCLSLSKDLGHTLELKRDIISQLPRGHKTIQLQWLRVNIKRGFEDALKKAFPPNKVMAKTYVATKWATVLGFIFPENAVAIVTKRKKECKRQKTMRLRYESI
jgi:hypothetical protein